MKDKKEKGRAGRERENKQIKRDRIEKQRKKGKR
jgi:hypothetical protein